MDNPAFQDDVLPPSPQRPAVHRPSSASYGTSCSGTYATPSPLSPSKRLLPEEPVGSKCYANPLLLFSDTYLTSFTTGGTKVLGALVAPQSQADSGTVIVPSQEYAFKRTGSVAGSRRCVGGSVASARDKIVPSTLSRKIKKYLVAANSTLDLSAPGSPIPTVSGSVPEACYYASSPCSENRRNYRRSSKNLGVCPAKLKKRPLLRSWKLQFIPSDHSKRRTTILCCILLFSAFLILTATGLVIYMSALGSIPTTFDFRRESGVNVVAGEFTVTNEKFLPALRNTESENFRQLAKQLTSQLDLLFTSSTISTNYNHSHVIGFRKRDPRALKDSKGVVVECHLVLRSAPPDGKAANEIGLAFLRGLRHRHGRMWLGRFEVDVQSIGFTAVVEVESSSNSPRTPDPGLIPRWSSWSPWSECRPQCTPGATRTRTRLCRLNRGRGESLSSIEPCLLQGGGDMEVRDCECSSSQMSVSDSTAAATTFINKKPIWGGRRLCDDCVREEVCVALSNEDVPTCKQPIDPGDPTGCGGMCHINTELCHKLDVDAFRCLDDSHCLPNEWRCANQLCIPYSKRCDGHLNCYDHTDEYNCNCDMNFNFHCGNQTSCLPVKKRCDGIIDCWDGSDELNCTVACPNSAQFTCTSGQCIPRSQFCDGYADCADGSDEPFGCGGDCKHHEWKCRNGRCVKKHTVCDGFDTCGDNSDEKNCGKRRTAAVISKEKLLYLKCQEDQFQCANGDCISQSLVCNTADDCGDSSDEFRCPFIRSISSNVML